MNPPQRHLTLAIGVSLLLHAILLSIHFKLPERLGKASERALDVILVNSKSATKPVQAQAKAQTNLDGGGNTDEDRRAKTPLPPSRHDAEGDQLKEAQRRVAQLEAQAQQMLTQIKSTKTLAADQRTRETVAQQAPTVSGIDLASSALAIARIEGQIARQLDDYNQRPRKKFIGARVEEYRFAQYVEDWRQKIERVGNLNYPEAARGKLYGSLLLTVIIKSNGELERVDINRSSGKKLLDEAAQRIVQLAAPYAAFPEAIRRDTDVIEITRTWTFTNADRLSAD